jgi:hypothetical protein
MPAGATPAGSCLVDHVISAHKQVHGQDRPVEGLELRCNLQPVPHLP